MKKIVCFLFIFSCLNGLCQAQTKLSEEAQIKNLLKEFYISYVKENSKKIPDLKIIEELKKQYFSEKLLISLRNDELDYDPILNAQDCDIQWLKTIKIAKDSRRKNLFIVSYIDMFSKKKNTIKLLVNNKGGNLKIDAIIN